MNTKIYYKVVGALYRFKGNESDLIEIDETFEEENPIVARENAFECYQNYIDVLLQSKGEEYISHKRTVTILRDFVKSGRTHKLSPDLVDMDNMSLNVYLVKKIPKVIHHDNDETDNIDTWGIHYLDNQHEDHSGYILKSLLYEFSLYEKKSMIVKIIWSPVIHQNISKIKEFNAS
jgi:hypothetical protein